ncbi:MAG TPA: substrate-binding domain-containing protein, partial [Chloroflexota bacterium]|nr:substrate-binding domain-containing protein [Chloroflexota bacterium]
MIAQRTPRTRLVVSGLAVAMAALLAACSSTSKTASSGSGSPAGSAAASASSAAASSPASGGSSTGGGSYVIGVSNTIAGNGWREEMICSIKAQALVSGQVKKVVVISKNGGPTDQIQDLQNLISQGVNAIIVNPSDPEK